MSVRRLYVHALNSAASKASLADGEDFAGRIAFLVGDILNSAAETGWDLVAHSEVADAVLVVFDDPEDETRIADVPANSTLPSFVIRLGRAGSDHMAVYPESDVGAFTAGSLVNPPDIEVGFEGMRLATVQWLANLPEVPRRRSDAELLRRVEHLEDTIHRLRSDTKKLLKMFRGKQEEVDRLTEQLAAVQVLLTAQKRTQRLDTSTIASIANTVGLLLNTAVMVWGVSLQPASDVQAAAIEVQAACVIEERSDLGGSLPKEDQP